VDTCLLVGGPFAASATKISWEAAARARLNTLRARIRHQLEVQAGQSFATYQDAYHQFQIEQNGKTPVMVHDNGQWTMSTSDIQGLVSNMRTVANQFTAMNTPYNFGSTNSNWFAHWFATQAQIPITGNPMGAWYFPGPWLYQWNYGGNPTSH